MAYLWHYLKMLSPLYKSFLIKNPSLKNRFEQGKRIRLEVGRSELAQFSIRKNRRLPIAILLEQAKTRIASLIPIRHSRMAVDPFSFYRGATAIMAHDLSKVPSPRITVQLCGDMHVSNFGFFSTSEHQLVFGINDFDETLPGNFDWDLKRLTASAMIASEQLGKDHVYGENIVRNIVSAYRHHLRKYADMSFIDLKRSYINEHSLSSFSSKASPQSQKSINRLLEKSRKSTSFDILGKLTEMTSEGTQLINNPPLLERLVTTTRGYQVSELNDGGLNSYIQSLASDRRDLFMRYKLIDTARKVVGVGSVGTACGVLYFEGRDADDPLFLQNKEAQKSVLEPYFSKNSFSSEGERVVHGQQLIQGAPDLFLGYGQVKEIDFYIRQLRDMKGGISINGDGINADDFPDYAKLFGWALANAHARSGDAAILAGYCGKSEVLDDALVQFSIAYSQQNQADYGTFLKAIKLGEICIAQHP